MLFEGGTGTFAPLQRTVRTKLKVRSFQNENRCNGRVSRENRLEAIKQYGEMGIQGVQMYCGKEFVAFSDAQIQEIIDTAAAANVEIVSICGDLGGHDFQIEDKCMARAEFMCSVVDTAVRLKCRIITTHIGVVPSDKNDPVYPIMLKSIRYAAEYAASKGCVFAIETGPEQPETLLALIEDVASKGLGVNLDPANLRMVSQADPVHAVEVLGKYIVHTHAKDGKVLEPGSAAAFYGMVNPDGTPRVFEEPAIKCLEVPLGQGQVPWDGYLAALKKVGYDGFLTIERECGEDPAGDIMLAYNFLKARI